jgi:hypothetical protein
VSTASVAPSAPAVVSVPAAYASTTFASTPSYCSLFVIASGYARHTHAQNAVEVSVSSRGNIYSTRPAAVWLCRAEVVRAGVRHVSGALSGRQAPQPCLL